MSVRPVVVLPDSSLYLCSEEVSEADFGDGFKELIDDMFDTMYAEHGIGLAAVQIGVHKRVFIVDLSDRSGNTSECDESDADGYLTACGPRVFINPKIVERSGDLVAMEEGCLSIPGQREWVVRHERVAVQFLDQSGQNSVLRAGGLLARCLQHEMDHLDGVVFLKHVSKLKRDLVMKKLKKADCPEYSGLLQRRQSRN
ncbi:peptide deformylase [Candidatus Anaplasma sp. TIGMIC]|uniref:peptide deformylase n=1 Tax=Candidatus Anaplasma sp. TIGMIC TaxID=3020713 RepID=UPI00232C9CD7|nr:peptide deformylase [Candidatus Anaplasma sp. TIGMIC]MDB1135458.1 peptide deformylase [Candidatus Anaplasma sp. TIGMIC]